MGPKYVLEFQRIETQGEEHIAVRVEEAGKPALYHEFAMGTRFSVDTARGEMISWSNAPIRTRTVG